MNIETATKYCMDLTDGKTCCISVESWFRKHRQEVSTTCSAWVEGGIEHTEAHSSFEGMIAELAAKLGKPNPLDNGNLEVEL